VNCGKDEPTDPEEPVSEQEGHLQYVFIILLFKDCIPNSSLIGCSFNLFIHIRIIIVVFGVVCTLALIFGQRVFTSVVSIMTGAKVSCLINA